MSDYEIVSDEEFWRVAMQIVEEYKEFLEAIGDL